MPHTEQPNDRTPSTMWEWRRVKIRPAPQAESTASEASSPEASLLPWPRGKPMTVVLKYRGGPEGWVEVRARGRVWRRPGVIALYDLMCVIYGHRLK